MQAWGGVTNWNVVLQLRNRRRQEAVDAIANLNFHPEPEAGEIPTADGDTEPEGDRFLLPLLGTGKSFDDIVDIVDAIESNVNDEKIFKFPCTEFLPVISPITYPSTAAKERLSEKKLRQLLH